MPRPPRHPFTSLLRRALSRPLDRTSEGYLRLLDRRFVVLGMIAAGAHPDAAETGRTPRDRALVRRFFARRRAAWNDGDENLVREYLDRWERDRHVHSEVERARGLLAGAEALVAIGPPPGALWFFLWEMESILGGLFEADKGSGPC